MDRGGRREPTHEEQGEVELELEYFERVPLTARLALLRVAGTWSGHGVGEVDRASLVVDDGVRTRRFKPLAEPAESTTHQWRAAYAVPVALTGLADVGYALEAGALVDLPPPTDRTLAQPPAGDPAPAAANGEGLHGPRPLLRDPEAEAVEAAALAELADSGERRWWRVPVLVAGAVLFVVGAGLLAVVLGSSTESDEAPRPSRPYVLAALPGGPPGVSARLRALPGGRFELSARGLPPGRYLAWAYADVISARPLGTVRGPVGSLRFRPPPDAAWNAIDLSKENDANPNHSGVSVLRVSRADLRRAAAEVRAG